MGIPWSLSWYVQIADLLITTNVHSVHAPSSALPVYRLALGKPTPSGCLANRHVERTAWYWVACAWLGSRISSTFIRDRFSLRGVSDPHNQRFSKVLKDHWVLIDTLTPPERDMRRLWAQKYIDILTSRYRCQLVSDLDLGWRNSSWSPPKDSGLPSCPAAPSFPPLVDLCSPSPPPVDLRQSLRRSLSHSPCPPAAPPSPFRSPSRSPPHLPPQ